MRKKAHDQNPHTTLPSEIMDCDDEQVESARFFAYIAATVSICPALIYKWLRVCLSQRTVS